MYVVAIAITDVATTITVIVAIVMWIAAVASDSPMRSNAIPCGLMLYKCGCIAARCGRIIVIRSHCNCGVMRVHNLNHWYRGFESR
ncbi:hypothetical protein Lalb_Chr22g0358681 [Lupinus albus]|uniref:Uncharacterized protein n=1 Tax=Lupinus albus TaxID=3870 RepID=A0A6A4NH52_LUPAL|nr:hypothetical protein Lalb_Chr22g0358681 [Lupinus albus]